MDLLGEALVWAFPGVQLGGAPFQVSHLWIRQKPCPSLAGPLTLGEAQS